ncbi:MAG: hypothetical protein A2W33_01320 [Chloroflexi bacterium RBG_16_52_11]|nr:MAG: hypothetical protein A2W33_01320 [Chloroflexi bacterium RBG_16_52_11]
MCRVPADISCREAEDKALNYYLDRPVEDPESFAVRVLPLRMIVLWAVPRWRRMQFTDVERILNIYR